MSKVLVIGAGGVGSVAVHKMAMNSDIFPDITLASRRKFKCDAIAESVKERTGVTPEQYPQYASLRGDPSDGLPGVAGVGEKTAATLLRRFGDLDGIIAAAADPSADLAPGPRRKIKDAAEYLAVATKVVGVVRDLDLGGPDLTRPRTPAHPDRLLELSERWGLGGSVTRLVDTLT